VKSDRQELESWREFRIQDSLLDVMAVVVATELDLQVHKSANLKLKPRLRWCEWESVT
jgi:hypothetical protein